MCIYDDVDLYEYSRCNKRERRKRGEKNGSIIFDTEPRMCKATVREKH